MIYNGGITLLFWVEGVCIGNKRWIAENFLEKAVKDPKRGKKFWKKIQGKKEGKKYKVKEKSDPDRLMSLIEMSKFTKEEKFKALLVRFIYTYTSCWCAIC